MKYILVFLLLFICAELFAPNRKQFYIIRAEAIDVYEQLIKAVVAIESNGNILAYNPMEEAVGAFQIRQCKVDDFNKRTGKNYKLMDMFNFETAREVFIYFACLYPDYETIARRWNGSGPMTETYWEKVKSKL